MAFKFKKPSPYKIFGSKARKDEQKAAKGAFDAQMRAYEGMDVGQNFYAGWENPYEDLSMDTTAQQLAANQYAQSMANISGAIDPSNVGAVLRQAGQQALQTRAQTAQQEMANQRMAAQGAIQQQQMVMGGEEAAFGRELSKQETMLGMAAERKAAADAARASNTAAWMGLAGSAIGAAGSIVGGGLAGGKKGG